VRMYNPPNPRLTTPETSRLLEVCQAKSSLSERKDEVATKVVRGRHGNTRTNDTLFQFTIEGVPLTPLTPLTPRIGAGTR